MGSRTKAKDICTYDSHTLIVVSACTYPQRKDEKYKETAKDRIHAKSFTKQLKP